jgi:hypothetical protein
MSTTSTGLLVGLVLALVVAVGGWGWFFLALLFGGAGALIGAHLEGRIDLRAVFSGRARD